MGKFAPHADCPNSVKGVFFDVLSLILAVLFLCTATVARAEQATVFAAASLRNVLDAVKTDFEAETGYKVTLAYAGSSIMARQIEIGAPADVFISANAAWMDYLEGQRKIVSSSRFKLVGNRLVLVGPAPGAAASDEFWSDAALLDLLQDGRLAMAMVQSVPAGIYGKQALESLGLWERIAPQIAQTDNVRTALALVATKEASLGIVYASDAAASGRVAIIAQIPSSSHDPIIYPAAAVSTDENPARDAFLAFLKTKAALEIFGAQDFVTDLGISGPKLGN